MPVIEVRDLVKRYRKGTVNAVDGISFAVATRLAEGTMPVRNRGSFAIAIARLFDENRRLIRQLDRKAEELEQENTRLKKLLK